MAELGNNSVDVIDLAAGKPIHRITHLPEPQGIAYVPKADMLVVANAGDGTVRLFRGGDYTAAGSVALGADADNVRIDPRDGSVLVGYGSGGLAIIDPSAGTQVTQIPLPAHPEAFALDPAADRVFVNEPDAGRIVVADLKQRRAVAQWHVAGAAANFPMALDASGNRLAVVFRSPPLLVLLDPRDGHVISRAPTCEDGDDVFFDPPRTRLYISCGGGEVAVFTTNGAVPHNLASVRTAAGARTSLFVPELDRLFVARRARRC